LETGTWAFAGSTSDTNGIRVPISFFIPLAKNLSAEHVHFQGEENFETFCTTGGIGSTTNPQPQPGELCFYENAQEAIQGTKLELIASNNAIAGEEFKGASRTGAVLVFKKPTEAASGSGSFGVRAP
jgi:hypothetical protein